MRLGDSARGDGIGSAAPVSADSMLLDCRTMCQVRDTHEEFWWANAQSVSESEDGVGTPGTLWELEARVGEAARAATYPPTRAREV